MSKLGDGGAPSGAGKPGKSKESKRGGKRTGAGRKPGVHAAYRNSIPAPRPGPGDIELLGALGTSGLPPLQLPIDRRQVAELAFHRLALLMYSVDQRVALVAARAILDRVEGRPRQSVEVVSRRETPEGQRVVMAQTIARELPTEVLEKIVREQLAGPDPAPAELDAGDGGEPPSGVA